MQECKKKDCMCVFKSCQYLYRRFLKRWPPMMLVAIFCLVIFIVDFASFSEKINTLKSPVPLKTADGIIVFTGGYARLETGLRLLEEGKGRKLLISGVNPKTGRDVLIRAIHADPQLFECCVDLGREALNTIGNAEESTYWVAKNNYHRVFIVTNAYHMPRSLSELKRKMPSIELIPYPVEQNNGEAESWWQFFEWLRILMVEYIKFLGVSIRNSLDIIASVKFLVS
ncbi:MAG: hypothetical protein JSC189_000343 [Candidatus Tokpelaia sp. JSC189]|nr:MAG: hypothetical protein JSC189_000343 [Candidatus Tokpelaia sp. JSC189]